MVVVVTLCAFRFYSSCRGDDVVFLFLRLFLLGRFYYCCVIVSVQDDVAAQEKPTTEHRKTAGVVLKENTSAFTKAVLAGEVHHQSETPRA